MRRSVVVDVPPALLLVSGEDRQQDHVVAGFEHLRRHDDVGVDAQRDAGHGGVDPRRVREDLAEVAARGPQDVDLAPLGGIEHLGCGEAGRGRDVEAPQARTSRRHASASTGRPPGNAVA